jgi:hypothetical protein
LAFDATDLKSVVDDFSDVNRAPVAIRDDWKTIGEGYSQLLAKLGDISLNPPPTDPGVRDAFQAVTEDPTVAAALQRVEKYCGLLGNK